MKNFHFDHFLIVLPHLWLYRLSYQRETSFISLWHEILPCNREIHQSFLGPLHFSLLKYSVISNYFHCDILQKGSILHPLTTPQSTGGNTQNVVIIVADDGGEGGGDGGGSARDTDGHRAGVESSRP